MKRENWENADKINNSISYVPETEDPLDVVIDILDDDNIELKKTTHPYVPLQVQTAPTIELETQVVDDEFANLKEQFDRVGNAAAKQKMQKGTEELVDSIIKGNNPFQNVEKEDIWIEDDLFDSKDSKPIIEVSKKIIDEITLDPLIELNIATPLDTDNDEMEDDIDFTTTDSQLVEGNDTSINRETEPFVDFKIKKKYR